MSPARKQSIVTWAPLVVAAVGAVFAYAKTSERVDVNDKFIQRQIEINSQLSSAIARIEGKLDQALPARGEPQRWTTKTPRSHAEAENN